MSELKEACRRVEAAAAALGLTIAIRQMAQATRTAADAASAVGCDVDQIVKSLVFQGAASGKPYLLLVSGANRVDEAAVAADIGEGLVRPNGKFVREATGYAIGGIPPFGHASELTTFIDRDLLKHERVWAAAGTPESLFSVATAELARATRARSIAVTGA